MTLPAPRHPSPATRHPRRDFLKTTAAAALAVPYLVPSSVFGAAAPSGRIGVGFIGNGNQSTIDLPAFLGNDEVEVRAVCDVNTASYGYRSADQFLGRKPAQEKVNKHYADKKASGAFKGCDAYSDFRDVLGREDIGAVAIVVPDHWHGLMVVRATRAKKDIYCEKPLSLTISQGQAMVKAVREHQRILQTGSHYRSSPDNRRCCELVRNGRIGQLKRITALVAKQNAVDPGPGWKPMPVPEGFDYKMWLGPAPDAPYHEGRCFYRFRFNLDYSGGQTTNFGAHSIDVGHFGMGMDLSGPIEIEDLGSVWPPKGGLYNTATTVHFRALYANGVELECVTRDPGFGTRFEGTEGWVEYGYKGLQASSAAIKNSTIGPNDIHLPVSNPDRTQESNKFHIPDHVRNFIECVKSRQDPLAMVEIGHRTASACHLGNIAMLLKRKLRWDPAKEQFIGDDEANRMLTRPMRPPWTL